ncbi:MAG: hypothetical protein ACRD4F_02845 [Candidatus Angelobacter sp.]
MLHPGDHPFILHESVIAYAYARIRVVDDVEKALLNGTAKKREPASEELLKHARAGLVDSEFTLTVCCITTRKSWARNRLPVTCFRCDLSHPLQWIALVCAFFLICVNPLISGISGQVYLIGNCHCLLPSAIIRVNPR